MVISREGGVMDAELRKDEPKLSVADAVRRPVPRT
jgi:hypothetical protein